tara:strand:+ start:9037 stop:9588 length:552 start_codon:yes stop_codon:yes gene_type:complete
MSEPIVRILVPQGVKVQVEFVDSDSESLSESIPKITDFVKPEKITSQNVSKSNRQTLTPEQREAFALQRQSVVGQTVTLEDGKEATVVAHIKGSQFKVLTTDNNGRASLRYVSQRRYKNKPDVWRYWLVDAAYRRLQETPRKGGGGSRGGPQNWPNPVKRCSVCGLAGHNKRTHPHHCKEALE